MLTISAVRITFEPGAQGHPPCCGGKPPGPNFMTMLSKQLMARGPEERIVPEKKPFDDGLPSSAAHSDGYLSIIGQRAVFPGIGFGNGAFEALTPDPDAPDELDPLDLFRIGQPESEEPGENTMGGLLGMLFEVLDRFSDLVRDLYAPEAGSLPQSRLADKPTENSQADLDKPANDEEIEVEADASSATDPEESDNVSGESVA